MGADVLLAKDPNCRRWLARSASPRPRVPPAGGASAASAGAAAKGRHERGSPRRLHPLGQARPVPCRHAAARCGAPARRRHRQRLRRPRASAAAARSRSPRASSPSTASSRGAEPPDGLTRRRGALRSERKGLADGPPPLLPGQARRATSSSTCRPRARSTGRSCASAPRPAPSSSIRSSGSTTSRSSEPDMHEPARRLRAACARRWQTQWGLEDVTIDLRVAAAAAEDAARGRLEGHRRGATAGTRDHRALARLARPRLRPRRRHRLDHHRRASRAISSPARCVASAGHDEPADPLRRGSDEPGLLRHDEPGRRRGDDRGRARGARRRWSARSCAEAGIDPSDILEMRVRRQPDHAPPVPRHRPDRARRRALRARAPTAPRASGAARSASRVAPGARVYIAALHRRPCRRRCRRRRAVRRARTSSDEMTLLVDVGTNAEIVLGNRQRLLACSSPTGPAFEGAADLRRPARRAGRHRARAHRPRDAGAALQGHRLRPLVGRAGLRRGRRRDRRHRHLRLRHHRGDRPRCSSPASSPQDGVIDGALAARTPRIVADGPHLRLSAARDGEPRHRASPRTTCAPSSSPRRRSMPASRLLMDQLRHRQGRPHQARRRLRQPHRPEIRHGARA